MSYVTGSLTWLESPTCLPTCATTSSSAHIAPCGLGKPCIPSQTHLTTCCIWRYNRNRRPTFWSETFWIWGRATSWTCVGLTRTWLITYRRRRRRTLLWRKGKIIIITLNPVCISGNTFPCFSYQFIACWAQRQRPRWSAWPAALPQSGGNSTPGHAVMSVVGLLLQWWEPLTSASGATKFRQVWSACSNPNGNMALGSTSNNEKDRH